MSGCIAFAFTGALPNVESQIGCGTLPCYEGARAAAFADCY